MDTISQRRTDSPGYRIGRLFRANAKLMERLLACAELSRGQVPLFMETLSNPGRSQKSLSNALHIDAAATARTLRTLEDSGLVQRRVDPDRRRDKLVFPTPRAEALLPELLAILNSHNAILFDGFSAEDRTAALALLDRIIGNVESALQDMERQSK